LKQRIKIFEVPISYYPRKKKEGKKIGVSDGLKAAFLLIKLRFEKETWKKNLGNFSFVFDFNCQFIFNNKKY